MDAVLNLSTGEMIAQAIIAMLLITAPPDPVKLLFFNSLSTQTTAWLQRLAGCCWRRSAPRWCSTA